MNDFTTNKLGLALIKDFEGTGPMTKAGEHKPYLDAVGIWTIGYGSTFLADGSRVKKTTPVMTRAEAEELLAITLKDYEKAVAKNVKVPLTENQFSALVCFVYNVGEANFKSSTLLKIINKGDMEGAADQFIRWNKARVNGAMVELKGLTRRRLAERDLFLS